MFKLFSRIYKEDPFEFLLALMIGLFIIILCLIVLIGMAGFVKSIF